MKTLIGMTDFVLEQDKIQEHYEFFNDVVVKYANFLKQPLKLGMFVSCDEDGNVLSEKYSAKEDTENKSFTKLSNEYQQAKERCLFEGFSEIYNTSIFEYLKLFPENTIEHIIKYEPQLTQTAIKQLSL